MYFFMVDLEFDTTYSTVAYSRICGYIVDENHIRADEEGGQIFT